MFWRSRKNDYVPTRNYENMTLFLSWMNTNDNYLEARKLTYLQYLEYFVLNFDLQEWRARKNDLAIGRLNFIPLGSGELYYLRMLLHFQVRSASCSS